MSLFEVFRNSVNSIIGRNQEFEKLLKSKDISAVIDQMSNRQELILDAIKDYDTFSHEIMKREDKIITDKNGNFRRKESVWKLPVPYQVYINEISLVFLYGRPIKWSQLSETQMMRLTSSPMLSDAHALTARFGNANVLPELKQSAQCCSVCSGTMTESPMCKYVCLPKARGMISMCAGTSSRTLSQSVGAIMSG